MKGADCDMVLLNMKLNTIWFCSSTQVISWVRNRPRGRRKWFVRHTIMPSTCSSTFGEYTIPCKEAMSPLNCNKTVAFPFLANGCLPLTRGNDGWDGWFVTQRSSFYCFLFWRIYSTVVVTLGSIIWSLLYPGGTVWLEKMLLPPRNKRYIQCSDAEYPHISRIRIGDFCSSVSFLVSARNSKIILIKFVHCLKRFYILTFFSTGNIFIAINISGTYIVSIYVCACTGVHVCVCFL